MEKSIKKKMLSIALPIILQSLILSTINLTDVFMIGRVGEIEIASVGLSNQILFVFVLFCMGINNAGAVFIAQFYGRNEMKKIKTILAISLLISLFLASTFALMAYFIPHKLMRIYTTDYRVIELAISYLKIVSISYIFTAFTIVYSTLLRSMGNTKMAMYASIVTLLVNVTLNYMFIFGNGSYIRLEIIDYIPKITSHQIPKMGVAGAALATSIARFLEICTIVSISYIKKYDIFLRIENFKEITLDYIKEFFIIGLPVIGSHVIWSLGSTSLFMIYARVGTEAVAAMNISSSFERIAFIAIIGVGSSVGVIVGQELGKGNIDSAYKLSKDMLRLNGFLGIIVGLIIFLSADILVGFYNIPDDIKVLSANVIRIFGVISPLRALNFTNMVGILRAGGDTKRIFIIDMLSMWGTSIPMAFLGYKLGFPIYIVFLMASSEELTKASCSMYRFISKKWINIL